jgi:hypothetical protein
VFQRPVEYEAIEISIPEDDEQFQNSSGLDQDYTNCELNQSSVRRIQVVASHQPKEISRGVQVPVSYELTEFSTNKPQVSVYQESGQHSTNRFQIPINHEQAELTTDESLVGHKSVVCLTNKLQVPISLGIREFSTSGPQISVYTKSIEHSSGGLQIPVNHEYAVCLGREGQLERKVGTNNSMFSDTGFVTSMVSHFSSGNIMYNY